MLLWGFVQNRQWNAGGRETARAHRDRSDRRYSRRYKASESKARTPHRNPRGKVLAETLPPYGARLNSDRLRNCGRNGSHPDCTPTARSPTGKPHQAKRDEEFAANGNSCTRSTRPGICSPGFARSICKAMAPCKCGSSPAYCRRSRAFAPQLRGSATRPPGPRFPIVQCPSSQFSNYPLPVLPISKCSKDRQDGKAAKVWDFVHPDQNNACSYLCSKFFLNCSNQSKCQSRQLGGRTKPHWPNLSTS